MTLVRPDQFIVWTGDSVPADVQAIVRKVAGYEGISDFIFRMNFSYIQL